MVHKRTRFPDMNQRLYFNEYQRTFWDATIAQLFQNHLAYFRDQQLETEMRRVCPLGKEYEAVQYNC